MKPQWIAEKCIDHTIVYSDSILLITNHFDPTDYMVHNIINYDPIQSCEYFQHPYPCDHCGIITGFKPRWLCETCFNIEKQKQIKFQFTITLNNMSIVFYRPHKYNKKLTICAEVSDLYYASFDVFCSYNKEKIDDKSQEIIYELFNNNIHSRDLQKYMHISHVFSVKDIANTIMQLLVNVIMRENADQITYWESFC
jgi:hypothetical protein